MTNEKTKLGTPRYVLGTMCAGREYLFTQLPVFRSGLEARDYALNQQRNGTWLVFEERDVSRHGVVYGLARRAVATA